MHESPSPNPKFFAPDTFGQKIHECVEPIEGEFVITKHTVSSFENELLLKYLKENRIDELVLCGMQTNATKCSAKNIQRTFLKISGNCMIRSMLKNMVLSG